MHALRSSALLPRLLVAWFMLFLVVAGASPFAHAPGMQLVCSADGGIVMVVAGEADQAPGGGDHRLDCSLCLPTAVPLPTASVTLDMPQPLAHVLKPLVAAHIAA